MKKHAKKSAFEALKNQVISAEKMSKIRGGGCGDGEGTCNGDSGGPLT